MYRDEIIEKAVAYAAASPKNYVPAELAISPELAGVRIYDDPIFAFGSADDPMWETLKDPKVVSPEFMAPKEWLDDAKTVITWFLPFADRVKQSNIDCDVPSPLWRHGRVEGEELNVALRWFICGLLNQYHAVSPMIDRRWKQLGPYCSNWSERHAAYICGLGTFCYSRGLITRKGVAGRFGSVITTLEIEPDKREYTGLTEWCTECGLCAQNCPAGAIDLTKPPLEAKDQIKCATYLGETTEECGPIDHTKKRYGCGKCQTGVPCMSCRP